MHASFRSFKIFLKASYVPVLPLFPKPLANTYASPVLVATFRLYCLNISTPSLCCYTAASNFKGRSFNEAFGGTYESRRIAKNPNNQCQFLLRGLVKAVGTNLLPDWGAHTQGLRKDKNLHLAFLCGTQYHRGFSCIEDVSLSAGASGPSEEILFGHTFVLRGIQRWRYPE